MIHLAEINEQGICVGTKTVKGFITDGKHVEIPEPNFDYYVWRKYENKAWSKEKFEPKKSEPEPDLVMEKLTQIETRLKAIEEGQETLRTESLSK